MHQENNAESGGYAPKPAPLEEFNMKIRLYAVKEIEIDKNDDIIKEYIDNNYSFKEQDKYDELDEYFKNKANVNYTCADKMPDADEWTLARADEEMGFGTEDFVIWE